VAEPAVSPGWRKSSYSGNGDGNCVEVGAIPWRKSSHSGSGGGSNCVEAGAVPWRKSTHSGSGDSGCIEPGHVHSAVLVRDTKDSGTGPVLRVTPADWGRFTLAIRASAPLR
jgi:hypothetical protein